MSICKAIKFKSLICQLNLSEKQLFISSLPIIMISVIEQSIFKYCHKNSNNSEVDKINNLLKLIIRSRKNKPKVTDTFNIKLDKIPKVLIGVVASFLPQKNYYNFNQCNRSIYIACNNPILLKQLYLERVHWLSYPNIKRYQSLNSLHIDVAAFNIINNSLLYSDKFIYNLQKIKLFGWNDNCTDVKLFVKPKWFDLHRVNKLCLHDFGLNVDRFNPDILYDILKTFKYINYLECVSVWFRNNLEKNKLINIGLNLKSLYIQSADIITYTLIDTFNKNINILGLQYNLDFHEYNFICDFTKFSFIKLQELELLTPCLKVYNDIIKTTENIIKVFIMFNEKKRTVYNEFDIDFWETSSKQSPVYDVNLLIQMVEYLITKCIYLNNITLQYSSWKYINDILNSIIGNISIKNISKCMKIQIIINSEEKKLSYNILCNICRNIIQLIKNLYKQYIYFMFIFKFNHSKIVNSRWEKLDCMFKSCSEINNNLIIFKKFQKKIVFMNKNCNINGYKNQRVLKTSKKGAHY